MNTQPVAPKLYSGDLANLPPALEPLLAQPRWAFWRLVCRGDNHWSKEPFRPRDPLRHASSADPASCSDYPTALAAVKPDGNGISYLLTPEESFGALDIDHVRDPDTGSIADWAQMLLERAHTYCEVSPSGTGLRIIGTTSRQERLHRSFRFNGAGLELFRCTSKFLSVTGLQIGSCAHLGNIDELLDYAAAWAEQRKLSGPSSSTTTTNGSATELTISDIERIVREGAPPDGNRSDLFHSVVGHYRGCGWTAEQIVGHLEKYPDGIGGRYRREDRLAAEVERSLGKYAALRAANGNGSSTWSRGGWEQEQSEPQQPEPEQEQPKEPELPKSELPPFFMHGEPDPRPQRPWAIKRLMLARGSGLLSGQWGTYKSFMTLELAAALMTGQPFVGRAITRQSGVVFFAVEGASEMRVRLEALIREKCGGMASAPFAWYEDCPVLLGPDGADKLTAMGRRAAAALRERFGLPLGLLVIDTIAAAAGYAQLGAENDNAIGQRLMNVLARTAEQLDCFVLGIDHFGKHLETGTRGAASKEAAADLVLACLGEREISGSVTNMRLAIRKCRNGPQGLEFPFATREVQLEELDDDGEPVTTLVIDWTARATMSAQHDTWTGDERQKQSRQALRLLRQVLEAKLAEAGVDLQPLPDAPLVRAVTKEVVQDEFHRQTPADGTEKQKADFRRLRFTRALARALEKQLVGLRDVDGVEYVWLLDPPPPEEPNGSSMGEEELPGDELSESDLDPVAGPAVGDSPRYNSTSPREGVVASSCSVSAASTEGTSYVHKPSAAARGPIPTEVYDTYWRFAAERQAIFFRRLRGEGPPWTTNSVFATYKFTNAYRASDRVSQYLIRHVIYRDDLPRTPQEVFFRVLLFKLFNKIETWQLLEQAIGPLTFESYSYARYDEVLGRAMQAKRRIFSGAYIMPAGDPDQPKHEFWLQLLEKMMADQLPDCLAQAPTMRKAFKMLVAYPKIGDFLAYQYVIDLNYSEIVNFSEMDFVVPGPGAQRGLAKCFRDFGGFSEPDLIRRMADLQEQEFERLGLDWQPLYGRRLQLIDCQNLFCETDKYARVAHPQATRLGWPTEIKQNFKPLAEPIELFYPPKWGLVLTQR